MDWEKRILNKNGPFKSGDKVVFIGFRDGIPHDDHIKTGDVYTIKRKRGTVNEQHGISYDVDEWGGFFYEKELTRV